MSNNFKKLLIIGGQESRKSWIIDQVIRLDRDSRSIFSSDESITSDIPFILKDIESYGRGCNIYIVLDETSMQNIDNIEDVHEKIRDFSYKENYKITMMVISQQNIDSVIFAEREIIRLK